MRSLIITKMVPFPADDGGKLRTQALARALASRGPVVLCGFTSDGTPGGVPAALPGVDVRAVPRPERMVTTALGAARTGSVGSGRFWSVRMAETVAQTAASGAFDVALIEYPQLGQYRIRIDPPARCTVLGLQNVESTLVRSYAGVYGGLRALPYRAEAAALRRLERREIRAADVVTVVSERDRDALPARPRRVLICPNGWDPGPPLPPAADPVVAFVALLGWAPNVDAAVWFTKVVWPMVRARVHGARLLLVGRDPAPAVRQLAAPDVTVTGTVPDVRPHLAQARVAVAPLRAGGGSRLKVLEALDAARPVVGTTKGLEGLEDLIGRGAVAADGARDVADAVVALLNDPAYARQLGLQGHAAVSERYGWDVTLAPLLELVDGLAGHCFPSDKGSR